MSGNRHVLDLPAERSLSMRQRLPFFFSLRFLAPVILACTLALALSGTAGGTALAATAQQSISAAPQMPLSSVLYWNVCGQGYSDCYGNVGTEYGGWSVHWVSGPCCFLGFTVYWGDGGNNTYTCWVNCGEGWWYPPGHLWNHAGTFNTFACADTCSNTVRIHIS
jgi:hypothetical protein